MIKQRALPLLSLAALLLASVAHAADTPRRIVSTTPSVTGILLAMNAPLIATAATTPSRLSDAKGFFTQWAEVADQRGVQVLYSNLLFDIEAVIGQDPDLLVLSATGADSVIQHQGELQAQGINTTVVNYSNQSWQQMAVELGKVTGLEQQAQDAIKRFDDYTAQVAATLTPPAQPVSVVGYNIAGSYSVGLPSSPQARLLSALGFKVAGLPEALDAQVRRSSDVGFISRENLSRAIVGDSVFLLGGNDADVQAFLADPVLTNLPAVINKQVYPLGVSSFRIDYYSGRQMIDTVARSFH
ncbi:Fe2+-enterobactin ABC transporter substrate-binding protein [Pseudomonas helleri]|uniref:Fe2+-enterobactin ABC transporter substrate-binding protein n=1 Tax=Pseudomonas helleri TaxID=1608996 RepID=UPI003F943E1E